MLKCEKCNKRINLGLTAEEEDSLGDEIRCSGVVILHIECYEEMKDTLEALEFEELKRQK